MRNKKAESMDSSSKAEWSSQAKQWIELASTAITILSTGQENNTDREDDKDAEEYYKAEGALEDGLITGLSLLLVD